MQILDPNPQQKHFYGQRHPSTTLEAPASSLLQLKHYKNHIICHLLVLYLYSATLRLMQDLLQGIYVKGSVTVSKLISPTASISESGLILLTSWDRSLDPFKDMSADRTQRFSSGSLGMKCTRAHPVLFSALLLLMHFLTTMLQSKSANL